MIAEIYAFLNRNLLKPLNVQIDEMKDYLSSYRIDASDTVYFETNNIEYTVADNVYLDLPITIKIDAPGVARIKYTYSYLNMYIYNNGVQVSLTSDSALNVSHSVDLAVGKGDIITFKIMGRNATTSINKLTADTLNFCGYLTPIMETNLIELI